MLPILFQLVSHYWSLHSATKGRVRRPNEFSAGEGRKPGPQILPLTSFEEKVWEARNKNQHVVRKTAVDWGLSHVLHQGSSARLPASWAKVSWLCPRCKELSIGKKKQASLLGGTLYTGAFTEMPEASEQRGESWNIERLDRTWIQPPSSIPQSQAIQEG